MNLKVKTAILISGRGSNMRALIEAAQNPSYPAEIVVVISNKKDAMGLEFAQQHHIKTAIVDHKNFKNRQEFDQEVAKIIDENNCQIVCLAGFMRLLSAWFVNRFASRLINIHPSLLPAFKGGDAVVDALNYGVKITGCTVHFVVEEMDSGPIIKQMAVTVLENDNKATLAARILEKEHIIYPQALELICNQILMLKK